jgi:hypothetical protein
LLVLALCEVQINRSVKELITTHTIKNKIIANMAIAPPISFESSLNYVGLVVRVPPNSGIENVTIIPETSNDWNQLQQANKTIEMMHGTWNFVNESKATESGKFVFDAINFKQIFYN